MPDYFMLTLPDGRYFDRQIVQPGDFNKTVLLEISEAERKYLINLLIQSYVQNAKANKEPLKPYIDLLEVLTGPKR